jgi:Flp pilus assembly protein TadB
MAGASRTVIRLGNCTAVLRGQKQLPIALLGMVVLSRAVVNASCRGDPCTAAVLCVLATCLLVVAPLRGVVKRREKRLADRFPVDAGVGSASAGALSALQGPADRRCPA